MTLRVKKYFMFTSLWSPAMMGLASCSKGSMMFSPIELSRPAPRCPASMMPLAAPVTTSQSASAMALPNATAWAYAGASDGGPGRAEDGDLPPLAIGTEDLEAVTQLAQGAAQELQIAARRAILGQLVGRLLDAIDQIDDLPLAIRRRQIGRRGPVVTHGEFTLGRLRLNGAGSALPRGTPRLVRSIATTPAAGARYRADGHC